MSFKDKITLKINEISKSTREIVEDWLLDKLSDNMMNLNNGVYCKRITLREMPEKVHRFEFLQTVNSLDERIVCVEHYDGGAWTNVGRGDSYFMIYCSKDPENKYLKSLKQN